MGIVGVETAQADALEPVHGLLARLRFGRVLEFSASATLSRSVSHG